MLRLSFVLGTGDSTNYRRLELVNRKTQLIVIWCLVGAALGVLAVPLPDHYRAPWIAKLLDMGHLPLTGLLTLGLWWFSGWKIGWAFLVAASLTAAAELAQPLFGRSASLGDAARSVLGGLVVVAALSRLPGRTFAQRAMLRTTLVISLLTWPMIDAGPVLLDAQRAYRSFPMLAEFRGRSETRRWYMGRCQLRQVRLKSLDEAWAGRLTVEADGTNDADVILFPVVGDWSGYRHLHCEFSLTDEPATILLSVRDGRRVAPPQERFDLRQHYNIGNHQVTIDLEALARGDEYAPIDLTRVQSFHFVVQNMRASQSVLIHRVYLK